MYKTSAQQIRRLELRIAKLEKEAGLVQKIKNIPKTLFGHLKAIFKEFASYFKISEKAVAEKREIVVEALREQLELRLRASFDRAILLDDTIYVEVLKLNESSPELSTVLYGKHKMPIRNLPTFLSKLDEDGLSEDVKGAYVSWHKDFKQVLNVLKNGPSKSDEKRFFDDVKRASKFSWRIIRSMMKISLFANIVYAMIYFNTLSTFWFAVVQRGGTTLGFKAVQTIYASSLLGYFTMGRIGLAVTHLIEKVLRRRSSNTEEFDQLALGKQASRYPYTTRFARQLEAHV